MGINPYNEWEANYQILPGKEKVVAELQKLAGERRIIKRISRKSIWIAKEKLSQWHLREIIGGDENAIQTSGF